MGLDMYLTGDKFKRTEYAKNSKGELLRDEDDGIISVNEVFDFRELAVDCQGFAWRG